MMILFPLSQEESNLLEWVLSVRYDLSLTDEKAKNFLRMKHVLCANLPPDKDGNFRLPLDLSMWTVLKKMLQKATSEFQSAENREKIQSFIVRVNDVELAVLVGDSV